MTEEEVRDYALKLEQENSAKTQQIADKDKAITELKDDVVSLQRRNNNLFMQVEQQTQYSQGVQADPDNKEDEPESLEDFSKNKFKEYLK